MLERMVTIKRVVHMRNMALFEMRRMGANMSVEQMKPAIAKFHSIMIRLNDDIKQPWLTHEIARKGFGGGIRRAEQEA